MRHGKCIKKLNEFFMIIEPYTITTMLNVLYYYSVIEIKYNKLKKLCKPYISMGKNIINDNLNNSNYVLYNSNLFTNNLNQKMSDQNSYKTSTRFNIIITTLSKSRLCKSSKNYG